MKFKLPWLAAVAAGALCRWGGPCTIAPIATKRIGAIRAIINRILYVIGPPGPTAEILPSPTILAKLGLGRVVISRRERIVMLEPSTRA